MKILLVITLVIAGISMGISLYVRSYIDNERQRQINTLQCVCDPIAGIGDRVLFRKFEAGTVASYVCTPSGWIKSAGSMGDLEVFR